jgi:hypothetical protein
LRGCAGSSGTYAGITKTEAKAQAKRAVVKVTYDGDASKYQADGVRVNDILRRKNSEGQNAWLVTFSDKYANNACVYV